MNSQKITKESIKQAVRNGKIATWQIQLAAMCGHTLAQELTEIGYKTHEDICRQAFKQEGFAEASKQACIAIILFSFVVYLNKFRDEIDEQQRGAFYTIAMHWHSPTEASERSIKRLLSTYTPSREGKISLTSIAKTSLTSIALGIEDEMISYKEMFYIYQVLFVSQDTHTHTDPDKKILRIAKQREEEAWPIIRILLVSWCLEPASLPKLLSEFEPS